MWLMTRIGAFSIVQQAGQHDLTIRSRCRADLDRLRDHYLPTLAASTEHAGSAYPWRAAASSSEVGAALAKLASDIDYPAVREELAHSLGEARAAAYGKAWSVATSGDDVPSTEPPTDGPPWAATLPTGKAAAYGGVIVDAQGRLLLREVANHYDGYVWTFPKGRPDPGETPRQTALREVAEETGAATRILGPIPGEFLGGTTVNRYFLMLASGEVDLAFSDAETAGLRWATPAQARELIAQTTNTKGRARDLAVLDAAMACLPQPMRPIAQREDWKTRPMPARKKMVDIDATTGRAFTDVEMARIRCGFVPRQMEDKWFVFFEDGAAHLHRSWTGISIYRAWFARAADGWRVTKAEVNLHPHEHRVTGTPGDDAIARMFTLLGSLGSGAWDDASDDDLTIVTPAPAAAHTEVPLRDRFVGCLLGGAVGDALGAPVEFMRRAEILRTFGADGITQYAPAYGGLGTITDDTQMTLFTAEGLLRGYVRGCFKGITTYPGVVAHAYLRWLQTQGEAPKADLLIDSDTPGWLIGHRALHARRAPGNTCLAALRDMPSLGAPARNDSKGCGGVMRVAPVGLFAHRVGQTAQATFDLGTELAALTHGHPTGALTGGVMAVLVWALAGGASLRDALATAKACLRAAPDHQETLDAIEAAEFLATSGRPHEDAIAALGEGWVAEEALAISIYCALVATGFEHGVVLAVNHDGDSDSTGAMVGNLLGVMLGVVAIPQRWLAPLELREPTAALANDLHDFPDWNIGEYSTDQAMNDRIWNRYPGF